MKKMKMKSRHPFRHDALIWIIAYKHFHSKYVPGVGGVLILETCLEIDREPSSYAGDFISISWIQLERPKVLLAVVMVNESDRLQRENAVRMRPILSRYKCEVVSYIEWNMCKYSNILVAFYIENEL